MVASMRMTRVAKTTRMITAWRMKRWKCCSSRTTMVDTKTWRSRGKSSSAERRSYSNSR